METLVKSILNHYKSKEEHSGKSEKYYHLVEEEVHSNFDLLSNHRLLLLKSKLTKDDIVVVLSIFNNIFEKNYYIFQDLDYLKECCYEDDEDDEDDEDEDDEDEDADEDDDDDDDDDDEQMDENEFELMKTYDVQYLPLWLKYLNNIEVYDLKSYKKIPKSIPIPNGNPIEQSVVSINDIISMI